MPSRGFACATVLMAGGFCGFDIAGCGAERAEAAAESFSEIVQSARRQVQVRVLWLRVYFGRDQGFKELLEGRVRVERPEELVLQLGPEVVVFFLDEELVRREILGKASFDRRQSVAVGKHQRGEIGLVAKKKVLFPAAETIDGTADPAMQVGLEHR